MKKEIEDMIAEYGPGRCSKLYDKAKSNMYKCKIEGSYSLLKVTENYAQYAPALYDMAKNLL